MKKLLITLLLSLPFMANAQKSLEGFWGLDFYSSSAAVKQIIKARTGKLPDENSGPTAIGYKNCYFGGHKTYFVELMFNNDKLYGGDIILTPERSDLLNVYNNIVASIATKYNAPHKENCYYSAVTQPEMQYDFGTGAISAVWNIPSSAKSGASARITAMIENNAIKISYRDAVIYEQVVTMNDQYDY